MTTPRRCAYLIADTTWGTFAAFTIGGNSRLMLITSA
jgi:hypothetical protein